MHWNDWLLIGIFAVSMFIDLHRRRWIDATVSACLAAFLALDKLFLNAGPWQIKYAFLAIGATLIAIEVGKNYAEYKKRLAGQ